MGFDTDSAASPEATLETALAVHRAAGGRPYERHTDARADGAWTRLQEPGCDVLDTRIDFTFQGNVYNAVKHWTDVVRSGSR